MITFHFHLQPQYKYELFHINFTDTNVIEELNYLNVLDQIIQLFDYISISYVGMRRCEGYGFQAIRLG